MKYALAAVLAICGVALLVVGYTAPKRAEQALKITQDARLQTAIFMAQLEAKSAAEASQAEYERDMKRIKDGDFKPKPPSTPRDELPGAQLKPMFETLNNNLEDLTAKSTSAVNGVMQYCTGWLLLAAACMVLVIGSKPVKNDL